MRATIDRDVFPGGACVSVSRGDLREIHCSRRSAPGRELDVFRSFPGVPGTPVAQWVFGGCRYHDEAVELLGDVSWPLTWVHGDGCSGENLAGTQVMALRGVEPHVLRLDGRPVGTWYEDGLARYAYLGGVLPADLSRSRPEQARSVFERLEGVLESAGFSFTDIVRTWLFLEDLLDWYDDFNPVRTRFFEERGVFDTMIPASTGIGAANPAGAALVAGAVAVRPLCEDVRIFPVASPLQCPATEYRSSFSRAAEVRAGGLRTLYVSGTASIAPGGESQFEGDIDRQIRRTMEVIEAILESRRMEWADVSRMVVYMKDMHDAPRFHEYCRRRGFPSVPYCFAHAAVCRDDLLFEVEADAVAADGQNDLSGR